MAEIKTCEQYVLGRLQDLEEENDSLIINLNTLRTEYNNLACEFDTLKNIIFRYTKIRSFGDEDKKYYIKFDDIDEWNKDTREDFEKLVEKFHLVKEED